MKNIVKRSRGEWERRRKKDQRIKTKDQKKWMKSRGGEECFVYKFIFDVCDLFDICYLRFGIYRKRRR